MVDAVGISTGMARLKSSAQGDYPNVQSIAIGAAATQTVPFASLATVVTLRATVNCWFSVGGTAAAHVAGSDYLPANTTWMLKIPQGALLSFIQDSTAGWVSVTPAVAPITVPPPLLLDSVPGAGGAYSLRKLSNAYTGFCVMVRRSSDNTTTNIGFTPSGNLDVTAFNNFVGAGQGFVMTWYDQSGNGNHGVATVASAPQLVTNIATLNGRSALLFTQTLGQFIGLPNAANLNNPFLNGGYIAAVVNMNQAPSTTRYLWTTQGSGFEHIRFNASSFVILNQSASTTGGTWNTTVALSQAPHQIDVQYSAASLSNVPTISFDGTAEPQGATQPVGTIFTENGSLIGGNGGTAFPGYIAEMLIYKSQPAPGPVRANQKAYWGTP